MTSAQFFRVNSPKYIHETIEDEVVVANLDEGFYYSIEKIGVLIWNAIDTGTSVSQISETLSLHYGSEDSEIEKAVKEFLAELEQEGLIIVDPSKEDGNDSRTLFESDNLPASFEKPTFQKFTDMQQLLLLDPIHEVEETGWPNAVPQKVKD